MPEHRRPDDHHAGHPALGRRAHPAVRLADRPPAGRPAHPAPGRRRRARGGRAGGRCRGVATAASAATTRPPTSPPARPRPSRQLPLAADPLLKPADITGLGRYGNLPVLQAPGAPDLTPPPGACQIRPTRWGAQEMHATRFYQDGSTVGILEVVLRYDTAEQAKTAPDQPRHRPGALPRAGPAEATLEAAARDGARGPDGVHAGRATSTPSADADLGYYEVAVAGAATSSWCSTWAADGHPGATGLGLDRGPAGRPRSTAPSADRRTRRSRRSPATRGVSRARTSRTILRRAPGQRAVMISRISCAVARRRPADLDADGLERVLLGLRRCRTSRRRSRRRGPSSCPRGR